MKCISFNCIGLVSPAKKIAFRRLLDSEQIDIIYLHETLGMAEQVVSMMNSLKSGWTFHALDVSGQSGGITLGINPCTIMLLSS